MLAFVNTSSGRTADTPVEGLVSYDSLVDWARVSGIIETDDADRLIGRGRRRAADAERIVQRARQLRELVHETFVALAARKAPGAQTLEPLSAQLSDWYRHGRLITADGVLQWAYAGDDDLARPLWEAARAAARLLTSQRIARIRACDATDCGWWFLDDTKNRSRRWCDMKICGNRDKVRRFRERQR
ncbi:MAG: CGNR zinc finger domain-containing protein [Planctomycetota bacterium]|nr:CGNR zinc finger domain-containing protein [Planctomycetota bacterium]